MSDAPIEATEYDVFPKAPETEFHTVELDLSWLKEAEHLLASDNPCNVAIGVRLARDSVELLRCSTGNRWTAEIVPALRRERLYSQLQHDPFSSRSVQKPRGYSGDATLIDLVYRHGDVAEMLRNASPRGRAMASFVTQVPAARAVSNRRFSIACEIDNLASRCGNTFSCLSVACGHFREAEISHTIMSRNFSRCIAMDQDRESIRHAIAAYGGLGVDFWVSGLKPLLADRWENDGGFDFIYAAGLFDYLDNRLAIALVKGLFNQLKSCGKLWVPNFLPNIPDRGFMECFMDWWLIYRTKAELNELVTGVDPSLIANQNVFVEPEGNIAFLELIRR